MNIHINKNINNINNNIIDNSKSIEIENNNSSSNSLKEEFSFLINNKEKEDRYDIFSLRDMINNANSTKNKINSESNDMKNLLKNTNDSKNK